MEGIAALASSGRFAGGVGVLIFALLALILWRGETARPDPLWAGGGIHLPGPTKLKPDPLDVAEALEQSQKLFESGDHELAIDFLLNAIRRDPGSPSVFEEVVATAERVQASESLKEDPDAQDLGYELISRAEAMMPFLPVASVQESRERLRAVLARLDSVVIATDPSGATGEAIPADSPPTQKSEPPIDSSANIKSWLALAEKSTTPAHARLLLLQSVRQEWEGELLDGTGTLLTTSGDFFWPQWNETGKRIDLAETVALNANYVENVKPLYEEWKTKLSQLLVTIQQPKQVESVSEVLKLSRAVRDQLRKGFNWQREIASYRESVSDVPPSSEVTGGVGAEGLPHPEGEIANLNWIYSHRIALAWIKFIKEVELVEREGALWWTSVDTKKQGVASELIPLVIGQTEGSSDVIADEVRAGVIFYFQDERSDGDEGRANTILKLVLLLALDPELLNPYVREKFEESWVEQVENLNDEGRLLAAKLRIWKERQE